MPKEVAKMHTSNGIPFDNDVPPADFTYSFDSTLRLDGNRVSYSDQNSQWSQEKRAFVPTRYLAAFDGTNNRDFTAAGAAGFPRGTIYASQRSRALDLIYVRPLLTVYRPLEPSMGGIQPERLRVTGQHAVVQGRQCVILQETPGAQPGPVKRIRQWWVDPSRQFLVLRYANLYSDTGKPDVQTTINYRQSPGLEWEPQSWTTVTSKSNGTMDWSIECTVSAISINPALGEQEFKVDFPPGTQVFDQLRRTEFIVRPDGSERTIDKSEYGPGTTYEKLVETDPLKRPWRRYLLVLNWVLVATFGGLLAFKWIRRRS